MSAGADGNGADARDQSIGELVKDLAGETSTLVRQEIDSAPPRSSASWPPAR
jgi:hypothetical protein